ncbi:protein-methionine sulfoxide oxidase mical3a-like isoform X1 [Morone saxatilis]|uniref:protein-methionine sulfoxide oxidase mical3a-like isoform X1 n=1 Tax=Morone saxatilis TaxID=34816 RepID=UPI0015E1F5FF|nr:protein-methionine sulfoxide oxidase mical3a-like isoform X1 [Morone saxatilis]
MAAAAAPSAELQPSVPEVNGLQEPSLPKRLRGTPERIELENYRLSLQREEELEEVPEETLAEHNLSSVLDKATDADLGSSSSESDMEEEDEQEDQDQEEVEVEVEQQPTSPSDLGGVPWKEAVVLHAKLRGDQGEEGEGEPLADAVSREGEDEEEEDEEEEEEDEDDEESSDGKSVLRSLCDYSVVPVKTGNLVCLLQCMLTPCPDSIWPVQNSTCFLSKFVSCEVSLSQTLFSSSSASFLLFHPLLFIPSSYVHCVCLFVVCVRVYVCICMLFFLFSFGPLSPPAGRGRLLPLG